MRRGVTVKCPDWGSVRIIESNNYMVTEVPRKRLKGMDPMRMDRELAS